MRIRIEVTRGGRPVSVARGGSRPRKILLTLAIIGAVGAAAGVGSYSAYTATTANAGNTFAAGSVAVEDNDSDAAMLALANAKPGDSDTSCIRVRYTGSLASTVRLYATPSGTLPQYLTLTVTRGTDATPVFDDCVGFTADLTNYIGAGAGVVYSGSLSAFPTTYAAGLVDPTSGTPESWTTDEEHFYRFAVTLQDNDAAKSQTGSAAFTWEARNE
jgi:hypothetical protein